MDDAAGAPMGAPAALRGVRAHGRQRAHLALKKAFVLQFWRSAEKPSAA